MVSFKENFLVIFNIIYNLGASFRLLIGNMFLYPAVRFLYPKFKTEKSVITANLIFGLLFTYWLFGFDMIYAIIMCVVGYFIIDLPVGYCTIIALIMNGLAQLKVYLIQTPGWSLEIAGVTMMIFQKIASTTNNLNAGKEIAKGITPKREFNRRLAIMKKPSFIRWLSFCFIPFGVSSGPTFEYKLYEYTLTIGQRPPLDPNSRSAKRALQKYISSFISILCGALVIKYAKIETYHSDFYLGCPVIIRLFLCFILAFIQFSRYMPVWQAVEAATYQFGLFESGLMLDFDDASNKELIFSMWGRSGGDWASNWNHSTHINLKRYIFYPLLDNKYGYFIAHNAVYVVSALWHGFHPVLYLGLPEMLFSTIADTIFLKHFPHSPNDPLWRKIIDNLWMWNSMIGATMTWVYRKAEPFFYIRKTVYFIPTIIDILAFIAAEIIQVVHKAPISPRQQQQQTTSSVAAAAESTTKSK